MGPPNQPAAGEPDWVLYFNEELWSKRADELLEAARQRIDREFAAWLEEQERQKRAAEAAAAVKRELVDSLRREWQGKQASEIDTLLPRDPDYIQGLLNDPDLDLEMREKLLEVALIRAGSVSFENLRLAYPYDFNNLKELIARQKDGQPVTFDEAEAKRCFEYQIMAKNAVLLHPEMFDKLSESRNILPTGRFPATQLMHIMLQDGGMIGDHDARQKFEEWMQRLPLESQGRAVYHLADAAGAKDIGRGRRITGEGISGEVGIDPVSIGVGYEVQWEPPPDTHWKVVWDDLEGKVVGDLKDAMRKAEAGTDDAAKARARKDWNDWYGGYDAPSHHIP
jgi:hypothetical protein